jgi:hypothetical protein
MSQERDEAGAPPLPPWQPWTALATFSFLLHFVWEMLQAPFYAGLAQAPHWDAVLVCTRATLGDVAIALLAYAGGAVVVRRRDWLAGGSRLAFGVYLATGLAVTVALEKLSVGVLGRWAYDPELPRVAGVGLAPLLQWVVLPPLTLWFARRHLRPRSAGTSAGPARGA